MIFPGIVSEIRGKLNDKIYSRNSFGQYVRDTVPVSVPNTPEQLQWRDVVKDAVLLWRTLPDSIKSIYDFRAKLSPYKNSLNVTRSVSGYNFFIRHYILKYKAGIPASTLLPTLNSPSRFILKSLNCSLNSLTIDVEHISNNSQGSQYSYFSVYASPGVSILKNFPERQLMRYLFTSRFSGSSLNVSLLFDWENMFGAWSSAGQRKIFVGFQTFNLGSNYKSKIFSYNCINPNPEPVTGFPYVLPLNFI